MEQVACLLRLAEFGGGAIGVAWIYYWALRVRGAGAF